jgi:hypothetical protein
MALLPGGSVRDGIHEAIVAGTLEVGDVRALLAESVQFGNRERSVFRDDVGGDELAEDPEYVLGVKEAVAAAARSSSPTSPGSRC